MSSHKHRMSDGLLKYRFKSAEAHFTSKGSLWGRQYGHFFYNMSFRVNLCVTRLIFWVIKLTII